MLLKKKQNLLFVFFFFYSKSKKTVQYTFWTFFFRFSRELCLFLKAMQILF